MATQYVNGFSESDQMASILSSDVVPRSSRTIKPLNSIRIICRFYHGEKPYWNLFLRHHKKLGAQDFLVLVQSQDDFNWIEKNTHVKGVNIELIFESNLSGLNHDTYLKRVEKKYIKGDKKNDFQLLLDIDEFFVQHRRDISPTTIFEIYSPNLEQIFLPSILTLRLNSEKRLTDLKGTWGHVGRPLATTSSIERIANAHAFNTANSKSLPVGMLGMSIAHLWTRSFEDCLIKIFSRTRKDIKSDGREVSMNDLHDNELPRRLRLLAYLDLQEFYIDILPLVDLDFKSIDDKPYCLEFISIEELIKCITMYEEYKERLFAALDELPVYPTANFPKICSSLPTLNALRG